MPTFAELPPTARRFRLEFTIPGPITPWKRATPTTSLTGKRRSRTTAPHREYMRHIRSCGSAALVMPRFGPAFFRASDWPRDAVYDLTLRFFFQDERTRDDDNVEKIVKDGLKGVLWKDDAWRFFRHIHKTNALDRERPRIEVVVEVVDEHVRSR
jgi:hypothetical protein